MILNRGFEVPQGEASTLRTLGPFTDLSELKLPDGLHRVPDEDVWEKRGYLRLAAADGKTSTWKIVKRDDSQSLAYWSQTVTKTSTGKLLVNGEPKGKKKGEPELRSVGEVSHLPGNAERTGPLGLMEYFRVLQKSEVVLWSKDPETVPDTAGPTTVYYPKITPGAQVLRPGNSSTFKGIHSPKLFDKLNFLSLMLALFCGTASLPHILIRYYTVKDQASARKSTIVGIASIGFFYILTLYLGLGAMTSGALDVTDTNMAAPLLAKSMNEWLFAIISAIAFTTVLGTVSGLIIAASGAVVHDLMSGVMRIEMNDYVKIRFAKLASIVVGVVAIALGILFEKMNVTYLVGWAFSVAASANLPALVMLLFWKRTTRQGIAAAVTVGMVSSLAWILLSGDTFRDIYGLRFDQAPVPFSQPGIVTIPLGFVVLVLVSLVTQPKSCDPMTERKPETVGA
jgi:cation/acetate symporter